MTKPTNRPTSIETVLREEAYVYLETNAPALLQAVIFAVQNENNTPRDVFLRVLAVVGPDRTALALRCQQAAEAIQEKTQFPD